MDTGRIELEDYLHTYALVARIQRADCSRKLERQVIYSLLLSLLWQKFLDKKQLKGGGLYFGSQFQGIQSVMVRKTWSLRLSIDHGPSAVRKQREMDMDAQLTFSALWSPGPQPMGWCCPHLGRIFPSQVTSSGDLSPRDPRFCQVGNEYKPSQLNGNFFS